MLKLHLKFKRVSSLIRFFFVAQHNMYDKPVVIKHCTRFQAWLLLSKILWRSLQNWHIIMHKFSGILFVLSLSLKWYNQSIKTLLSFIFALRSSGGVNTWEKKFDGQRSLDFISLWNFVSLILNLVTLGRISFRILSKSRTSRGKKITKIKG